MYKKDWPIGKIDHLYAKCHLILMQNLEPLPFAKLQPSLSYEPHHHDDHEEVYYIINGTGKSKIGNEEAQLRDSDIIYIPENTTHSIINDGEEMIDFLAFGGHTGKQKKKKITPTHHIIVHWVFLLYFSLLLISYFIF